MGEFQVTVVAVGGHGCERDKGDGETVIGCERRDCVDCIAREYVRRLRRTGATVSKAEIHHWPHEPGAVLDNLLTGERRGSFPEREQYLAYKRTETKA